MWRAFTKDGQHMFESKHGRPVELGNDGGLIAIAEEENHHTIMVLLETGQIIFEYAGFDFEGKTSEGKPALVIHTGPRTLILDIAEETYLVNDLKHLETVGPDKDGWYSQVEHPIIWRPIWFTRHFEPAGVHVKVIGAQTTLPEQHGGHNVKKMVMLYPDGRIGIS